MPIRIRVPEKFKRKQEAARRRTMMLACAISFFTILFTGIIFFVYKLYTAAPIAADFDPYLAQSIEEETPIKKKPIISEESSQAASPTLSIIVSTDESADLSLEVTDEFSESVTFGGGVIGGTGTGGDGIGDIPGSGVGLGSAKESKSGFRGEFWDFKQLRNGRPSEFVVDPNSRIDRVNKDIEVLELMSAFYNKNWKKRDFNMYRRSNVKLYTNAFYMPNAYDTEACNAYDPTGHLKLEPGRWVIIYRARVQAPQSGTFRFVAAADSVMAVRFDGKNVLTAGMHTIDDAKWYGAEGEAYSAAHEMYNYKSCAVWEDMFVNFTAGKEFKVQQGKWYDMEVLISEIGGSSFGFCLLIDDVNDKKKKKTADGLPIFQLFRTALVSPNKDTFYESLKFEVEPEAHVDPPYDPDSSVWPAMPQ